MRRKFSHTLLILFLIYPHLSTLAKQFQLFDMTGKMPGVERVGLGYLSKLCSSKPARLLDPEHSSGYNIRECLKNTTLKCPSIVKKRVAEAYFESNRRELLKRVPVKKRKRREHGWLSGHPNQTDYELINRHVLLSRKSCFIISRACSKRGLSSISISEHESTFPLFESRSWGSCAIVGLSDDMLLHEYGQYIDAHDVVIRMGHIPLTKYKKYAGSRSDIVIYRPGALKRDLKDHRSSDVKAYLCRNPSSILNGGKRAMNVDHKTNFAAVRGSESIYCDKSRGENDFAYLLLNQLYKNMAPHKKPTTGTLSAIRLAFSRLCSRLDIYGISSSGGGTYFEPEAITKAKHGTELDSWLLHHLMKNYEEELQTCIYI